MAQQNEEKQYEKVGDLQSPLVEREDSSQSLLERLRGMVSRVKNVGIAAEESVGEVEDSLELEGLTEKVEEIKADVDEAEGEVEDIGRREAIKKLSALIAGSLITIKVPEALLGTDDEAHAKPKRKTRRGKKTKKAKDPTEKMEAKANENSREITNAERLEMEKNIRIVPVQEIANPAYKSEGASSLFSYKPIKEMQGVDRMVTEEPFKTQYWETLSDKAKVHYRNIEKALYWQMQYYGHKGKGVERMLSKYGVNPKEVKVQKKILELVEQNYNAFATFVMAVSRLEGQRTPEDIRAGIERFQIFDNHMMTAFGVDSKMYFPTPGDTKFDRKLFESSLELRIIDQFSEEIDDAEMINLVELQAKAEARVNKVLGSVNKGKKKNRWSSKKK